MWGTPQTRAACPCWSCEAEAGWRDRCWRRGLMAACLAVGLLVGQLLLGACRLAWSRHGQAHGQKGSLLGAALLRRYCKDDKAPFSKDKVSWQLPLFPGPGKRLLPPGGSLCLRVLTAYCLARHGAGARLLRLAQRLLLRQPGHWAARGHLSQLAQAQDQGGQQAGLGELCWAQQAAPSMQQPVARCWPPRRWAHHSAAVLLAAPADLQDQARHDRERDEPEQRWVLGGGWLRRTSALLTVSAYAPTPLWS